MINVATVPAAQRPMWQLLGFVQMLRANGYQIGVPEELDALRAAQACNVVHYDRLRWALRSLLSSNHRDWTEFNRLFDAYWRKPNRQARTNAAGVKHELMFGAEDREGGVENQRDVDHPQAGDSGNAASGAARGGASHRESVETMEFNQLTDENQMRAIEELTERLAKRMRRRQMRRLRNARSGRTIHLRNTLRKSLRHGGQPLELAYQRRNRRLPRLVMILDVSRSMSTYSYLFLRFARGIVDVFQDAEVFVFHTRLVHITEALREPDLKRVKDKLKVMSLGWSGGTRIGESLRDFLVRYGRLLNSRSIAVVISDGFDTGAPELLGEQTKRIRQRAGKLVWLNPWLGNERYEPSAAGMQAALPSIDVLASARDLRSLMALEDCLAKV